MTNNVEVDNVETDSVKTDNIETNNIEIDNTESDIVETDNVEIDNMEIDKIENDNMETDNMPSIEIDCNENTNSTNNNNARENNSNENDNSENDNSENDSSKYDNSEINSSENDNLEKYKAESTEINSEINNMKENKSENDTDSDIFSDNVKIDISTVNKNSSKLVLQNRKNNLNKKNHKELDNTINYKELYLFDDMLCDILIDNLFLGFRTHKVSEYDEKSVSKPPSPDEDNIFSETILDILARNLIECSSNKHGIDNCYKELYSLLTSDTLYTEYDLSSLLSTKLIKFKTFKDFFNSLNKKELDYFEDHAKRYIKMYHVKAGYQLKRTKRYKSSGKVECCLIATKEWHKGDVLNYCNGILCPMTNNDTASLKSKDFSVMFSSSLNCNSLFLGPGRFMNHDCQPNCEFIHNNGKVCFRVIKNIKIGEELTVFYGESYFGINNCACLCESCEKQQMGGYSRTVEESATSESEKESNSSHSMSSVLRHRRRAQPLSFRTKKISNNSNDSKTTSDKNRDYIYCCHCNYKIKKKSKEDTLSQYTCNACLRHYKIYGQNWPGRDPKGKKFQIEIVNNDNLKDFKDFFLKSIARKQIDETYDCIYDYYNRRDNKNKSIKNKTVVDIIKNHISESLKSKTIKKENQDDEDDIIFNNNDTLNDFINGTDYSNNNFNRKRRRVLDNYLKVTNKVIKKRKFSLYNKIPSVLSYETLFYYGFSDYTLELETDNENHYIFAFLSDLVKKYEVNDKASYDYNLLNCPLPMKNAPKVNSIVYNRHPIYLDPLMTPEIIYNTLFSENFKQQRNIITNIDLEFIKNRYNRNKLKKYLLYKSDNKHKIKTKINKDYKSYGVNSLLVRLRDTYTGVRPNIQKNNISDLNNSIINKKYCSNMNLAKLFKLGELVDCFSESGWYKAKIKKIMFDEKNIVRYYIHYDKWSNLFDEWISAENIRNPHEENKENMSSTIGL